MLNNGSSVPSGVSPHEPIFLSLTSLNAETDLDIMTCRNAFEKISSIAATGPSKNHTYRHWCGPRRLGSTSFLPGPNSSHSSASSWFFAFVPCQEITLDESSHGTILQKHREALERAGSILKEMIELTRRFGRLGFLICPSGEIEVHRLLEEGGSLSKEAIAMVKKANSTWQTTGSSHVWLMNP